MKNIWNMQIKMKNGRKNATEIQIKAPDKISANERRTSIKQPKKIITEGKQQKIKSAHGCARRDAKNKLEAELKLLVGDVIRDAGWSLGRSNAPRGSFRSKCQVKALLHGKMNKARIKLREKDEGGDPPTNRQNRNSTAGSSPSRAAWATPALSTFRAGLWRLWPRET